VELGGPLCSELKHSALNRQVVGSIPTASTKAPSKEVQGIPKDQCNRLVFSGLYMDLSPPMSVSFHGQPASGGATFRGNCQTMILSCLCLAKIPSGRKKDPRFPPVDSS
jgi:hypothetical protein